MGNMSGSYGSHYTLRQTITVNSQNVANNTSNVTVRMYLDFDGSGYYAYSNDASNGNMIINGTTIGYSVNGISFSSGVSKSMLLAEWSGNIAHNADGTKILNVMGSWNTGSSRIGSGSCNTSITLSTVPRASSISCTTANVTEPAIITINTSNPFFMHRVWVDFGNLLEIVISEREPGGSLSWIIPESFYNQMPHSKSKTGVIYCRTYSGETEIGLKTANFTVTTNEEKCKPSLSANIIDINEDTVNLTENNKKLIKHKSSAKISISTIAKNGASISTKKVNNAIVNRNDITIQEVETDTFIVTAIDSRGYSNSVTLKPQMIDYVPLSINSNIKRTQPTTGEVDLSFTGNYFNENFSETISNTLEMKWFYREQNTESWTSGGTIEPVINGNIYSNGNFAISLGEIFDYQKAYEFYLEVKDRITTLQPTFLVTQGIPIFDWGKNFFNINGDFLINEVSMLPQILYEDETGITGTSSATLNQTITDFKRAKIVYDVCATSGTKFIFGNVKEIDLTGDLSNFEISEVLSTQSVYATFLINGSQLTVSRNRKLDNNAAGPEDGNYIYIRKIIGYKEV